MAELIRGQLLKEDKTPQGETFYEVGVRNISNDGLVNKPEKSLQLSGRMRDRAELQRLQPGDILLVSKGSVGKIGLVGNDCDKNWVASQSFQVVRLTHTNYIASSEYLFRYLSSPLVQEYLSEQITGTTIPVLKTADIKELPIPIVSLDEQKKIVQTHNKILDSYKHIHKIQNDIDSLRNIYWPL